MQTSELTDVAAANIEAKEAQRRAASQWAADYCGARSVAAFLLAVTQYQRDIEEIERQGKCVACGWGFIPGTRVCCDCGRDNS